MAEITFPFLVSLVAAVTTGIFAAIVLWRWWHSGRGAQNKRRPYLFAWGVGLTMYFLGTLSQVILYWTWSPFFFGLWYWTGALMVAPWLGQGTIYLLVRRGNIARNFQMALLLVGVMTLPWTLFLTPFNAAAWQPGADMTVIYRDATAEDGSVIPGIMPGESRGTVRFFSPIMNVWGTIALVGGAIWSARLFRKKQIMRNRMIGNLFIAAGGLLPAFGGVLIRLGDPSFKYFGEMAGAVLIFAGFLLATNMPDEVREQRTARQQRSARSTRQRSPAPENAADPAVSPAGEVQP